MPSKYYAALEAERQARAPRAPATPPPSRLEQRLTPNECAYRLRVHVTTIWRLIQARKIWPIEKLGRRIVRIPESSVERYLETVRVE